MEEHFSSIKPVELKCKYKNNPTGIDEKCPGFSWIIECRNYNSFQIAYRILVSSSTSNLNYDSGEIWDTGKVQSRDSIHIRFSGQSLRSNKIYYWKVMVWNEKDEASMWSEPAKFSTGLLEQDEWIAKWIQHNYKEVDEQEISFRAGIDNWIWFPLKNPDERFQTIQLQKSFQLKNLDQVQTAKLIVTADEKYQLLINNKFVSQSDDKIFSWARPFISDVKDLLVEGNNLIQATGFNSYVDKPGFILRIEILYSNGGTIFILTDKTWQATIKSGNIKFQQVMEVATAGDLPWRLPKAGLEFNPVAYLRKTFTTAQKVTQVFVYCSALGLYNICINSKPVTDSRLTPGWSNFYKKAFYNPYDVTSLLNPDGENIINVILADGYYAGYCGWEKGRGYYGKYPAFKMQLMIIYEDGSEEVIISDESWTSGEGPIREADILMGEFYDSDFDYLIKGWDKFNSANPNFSKVKILNEINPELISYKCEEVKPRQELKPVTINKINEHKFILDFNQNFAGYVKLYLRNVGKRKITLRFAEVLNEDGSLYTDNIRMARAEDTYISKGDEEEIWEPLFTYHGFRYVEVTGLENVLPGTITGISINSLDEQTVAFSCSNEKLNKLFECILWNQRSNYVDIPTDCPQRDERFGWTGDAVSFFRTAAFNFNVSAFYSEWFENVFDEQKTDGALPPFAPLAPMGVGPVYFNSAGWADVGVITPYLLYEFYGDINILKKYYERMKLFIRSLEFMSSNFILPDYGYGDWLFTGEETSKSFIATAYFAYDCSMMSKIAFLLEKNDDANYYNEKFDLIKSAFRKKFLKEDGNLVQLTQTAAVLAIQFNLLNENVKSKAVNFLTNDIIVKDYHTTTGFLGLSFLMPVLSSINRNDIAWKILTNSVYPSWFFMIDNGATTLWERWDSYHPEKGFYDPTMNSFNHCSLGCVGEWLFTDLAGIKILEPGFRKVMISPFIPDDLDFANATFKVSYGVIKSYWKKADGFLHLHITIPFNTSAIIVLQTQEFTSEEKYKILKNVNDFTYLEVGSGNYKIVYKL
ncbi:MAG: hypothetical protein C4539_03960 [Ignavibacteriales bacterium]|nr:MAG: hypothetical protein C4539_03960 [Ignavibacteriales bacterium]